MTWKVPTGWHREMPLDPLMEKFCELVADNKSGTAAWREASAVTGSGNINPKGASYVALRRAVIQERIAAIRAARDAEIAAALDLDAVDVERGLEDAKASLEAAGQIIAKLGRVVTRAVRARQVSEGSAPP